MNSKSNKVTKTLSPDLSLTKDQQELLMTALSSNRPNATAANPKNLSNGPNPGPSNPADNLTKPAPTAGKANVFQSPIQSSPGSGNSSSLKFDQSPFLEYDLDDGNFDWDNNGETMFGNLPGTLNEDDGELHDKRKNPQEEGDGEESGNKRREGEDKLAKKPGRKPLTGEPTTKRKAQNRAAQRAFRERKERHLKDLETKVEDLEKASEATNHENGRLRAQVERLNMEVREYRKRLSLNGTGGGRSPPSAAALSQSRHYPSNPYDIQFAFPKFGDLPGSNFMSNGSLTKVGAPNGTAQRPTSSVNPRILRTQSSSSANAESPMTTNGSFKIGSPDEQFYPSPTNSANDVEDLKVLFSPSILEYASQAVSSDYMTARNTRQPPYPENGVLTNFATPFNTSRSVSSISNKGLDSSCGTTPEPSADSPDNRKGSEGNVRNARRESADQKKSERTSAVAEKASKAQYDFGSTPLTFTNSTVYDINGIDWMAQQNGGQFDPVLFGDYRDPHENILSGFDSDLFNDTFNDRDFDTPFYTEDSTSSTIRPDLMKENRVLPNGTNGETASSHMSKNFLCEQFIDHVRGPEQAQTGEFDLDGLCSQLKAKARCSGTEGVHDRIDLDGILGLESLDQNSPFKMFS